MGLQFIQSPDEMHHPAVVGADPRRMKTRLEEIVTANEHSCSADSRAAFLFVFVFNMA